MAMAPLASASARFAAGRAAASCKSGAPGGPQKRHGRRSVYGGRPPSRSAATTAAPWWFGSQARKNVPGPIRIITTSSGMAQMAPPTSLKDLAELARRAPFFIGSDTGPLHLAAAVGASCVGLYGPMPAERNGPYGSGHIALQNARLTGSSRSRRTANNDSMRAIEADEVCARGANQILERQRPCPRTASTTATIPFAGNGLAPAAVTPIGGTGRHSARSVSEGARERSLFLANASRAPVLHLTPLSPSWRGVQIRIQRRIVVHLELAIELQPLAAREQIRQQFA